MPTSALDLQHGRIVPWIERDLPVHTGDQVCVDGLTGEEDRPYTVLDIPNRTTAIIESPTGSTMRVALDALIPVEPAADTYAALTPAHRALLDLYVRAAARGLTQAEASASPAAIRSFTALHNDLARGHLIAATETRRGRTSTIVWVVTSRGATTWQHLLNTKDTA